MTDIRTDRFGLSSREVWALALAYVVGPIAMVSLSVLLARVLHLDEDVVFFCFLGLVFGSLTLLRPWWFWDHPKAGFLRGIIGDRATIVVYSLFAIAFVALGGRRAMLMAEAGAQCETRYATAVNSHERIAVNSLVPREGIPSLVASRHPVTCAYLTEHGFVKQ
jgi:hypothetical protein